MPLSSPILECLSLRHAYPTPRPEPGSARREAKRESKESSEEEGAYGGKMVSPVTKSPFRGMAKSRPKSMLKAPAPPHNPPASRRPSADFPGGLRTFWGQCSPYE